jgi:hypothetical protein
MNLLHQTQTVPPETKFKGAGSIAAQDPFKQRMGTK